MEWTQDDIKFLMDDTVIHTVDISVRPQYKEPMYVLINFAMGGNGGAVDDDPTTATYEIDYVATVRHRQQ